MVDAWGPAGARFHRAVSTMDRALDFCWVWLEPKGAEQRSIAHLPAPGREPGLYLSWALCLLSFPLPGRGDPGGNLGHHQVGAFGGVLAVV